MLISFVVRWHKLIFRLEEHDEVPLDRFHELDAQKYIVYVQCSNLYNSPKYIKYKKIIKLG